MSKEIQTKAEAILAILKRECVTMQQRAELRKQHAIRDHESDTVMFKRVAMKLAREAA